MNIRVSNEVLHVATIQYLTEENHMEADSYIKVFPCRTRETANAFVEFYRKKYGKERILSTNIQESNIFG